MKPRVVPWACFLAAWFLLLPAAAAWGDDACLVCHEQGSSGSRLHILGARFEKSVHGRYLSCLDCHPEAAEADHVRRTSVAPVRCDDCHAEASGQAGWASRLFSFRVKGHAKGDLAESFSADRCLDCHQGRAAHGEARPLTKAACHRCHGPEVGGRLILGNLHSLASSLQKDPRLATGDVLYLLGLAVFIVVFAWGWINRIRVWRQGRAAARWDRPWTRWKGWFKTVFGQRRNFRRPLAGSSHYLIFLGVSLPLLVILAIQAEFTLPRPAAGLVSFLLDLAGLGLLIGVGLAVYRRVRCPNEYPFPEKGDLIVLVVLGLIGLSGFLVEGARLAVESDYSWASPAGNLAALVLPASPLAVKALWRVHFLLVLLLLALTPYTRLRHVFTAPLNIYFRNIGPKGRLESISPADGGPFGLSAVRDLSWKGLLDADACLACGRCLEVCPAALTEKPLSPLKVMRDIGTLAEASRRTGHGTTLRLGRLITEAEVWSCTTCQACQEACPVLVEHLDKIVGLRRNLVLDEGRLPKEAAVLLRNLEVYGDPSGHGPAWRTDWLRTAGDPVVPRPGPVVLWVGCQGAFHPRGRQVAGAMLKLIQRSGEAVNLLGREELCCGDPARRLGGEDVFRETAGRNVRRLKEHGVKTIIAFCPHCYNTLKHEYPDLGGDFTVLSAAEWISGRLSDGRLIPKRKWPGRVTFHDPCYLGRINELTESPRRVLRAVSAAAPLEMVRSRSRTFCCGGGGGGLWLHESGLRINQVRARECLDTGAGGVATACPYCLVMLEDGLGGLEGGKSMEVLDLIELVEWATR
ncbi:MAG: (Fe-S)-binding protein [Thermodesulfobacteriota bacterium]